MRHELGGARSTLQFSLDLKLTLRPRGKAAINVRKLSARDLPVNHLQQEEPADTRSDLALNRIPFRCRSTGPGDKRIAPKISQLSGRTGTSVVAEAASDQAKPRRFIVRRQLEDVRTAMQQARIIGHRQLMGRTAYQVGANDQLLTSKEYRSLVVAYRNGAPVMLSDVAMVIDGVENVNQAAWMNNVPAVIVNIQRQPGANIIQVVDRIKRLLPQLNSTLPSSVQVSVLTDRTLTIRESVETSSRDNADRARV